MSKIQYLLTSRKFWAALFGVIMMILQIWWPDLPLDAEQIAGIVAVLAAYILGTALEDGLRNK